MLAISEKASRGAQNKLSSLLAEVSHGEAKMRVVRDLC